MALEGRIVVLYGPRAKTEAARLLATLDDRYPTRAVVDLAAVRDRPRLERAVEHLGRDDVLVTLLDPSWQAGEESPIANLPVDSLRHAFATGTSMIAVTLGAASIPLPGSVSPAPNDSGAVAEIKLTEQTWGTDIDRIFDEIERVASEQFRDQVPRHGQTRVDTSPAKLTAPALSAGSFAPHDSYRLRSVSTFIPGADFDLYDGVTVGRARDAGIRLDHPDVSRHHAILNLAAGSLTVSDADSTNGTWVNEERIASESPTELSVGDVITFGTTEVQLRLEGLGATPTDSAR